MRYGLLVWMCAAAGVLGSASEAAAAKFVAGLTSLKVSASPGDVSTHNYELTLDKDERPTRFRSRIEDWWRSEDGSQSFFAEAGTLDQSCGTWVSLNPVEAIVEPGQTLTLRLTISVPENITPGGYWCVLTVDEVPDPLNTPSGVGATFVASVSTGIFIYIDPVERAVEFLDVEVGGNTAALRLQNQGNTPVGVEGQFEFFRPGDLTLVAAIAIPRTTLLPEPVRTGLIRVPLPSSSALPPGTYTVRAILDIGLDHYIGVEREVTVSRDIALQSAQ
jgi:hypothetical protein